tara:strand:- start:34 stop:237 length:204 start_codon:yes stop_codon:yes gene_type:complete
MAMYFTEKSSITAKQTYKIKAEIKKIVAALKQFNESLIIESVLLKALLLSITRKENKNKPAANIVSK